MLAPRGALDRESQNIYVLWLKENQSSLLHIRSVDSVPRYVNNCRAEPVGEAHAFIPEDVEID
jgi:hypothetical protein